MSNISLPSLKGPVTTTGSSIAQESAGVRPLPSDLSSNSSKRKADDTIETGNDERPPAKRPESGLSAQQTVAIGHNRTDSTSTNVVPSDPNDSKTEQSQEDVNRPEGFGKVEFTQLKSRNSLPWVRRYNRVREHAKAMALLCIVERPGATDTKPKTVKLHLPYWVLDPRNERRLLEGDSNDKSLLAKLISGDKPFPHGATVKHVTNKESFEGAFPELREGGSQWTKSTAFVNWLAVDLLATPGMQMTLVDTVDCTIPDIYLSETEA